MHVSWGPLTKMRVKQLWFIRGSAKHMSNTQISKCLKCISETRHARSSTIACFFMEQMHFIKAPMHLKQALPPTHTGFLPEKGNCIFSGQHAFFSRAVFCPPPPPPPPPHHHTVWWWWCWVVGETQIVGQPLVDQS